MIVQIAASDKKVFYLTSSGEVFEWDVVQQTLSKTNEEKLFKEWRKTPEGMEDSEKKGSVIPPKTSY